MSGQVRLLAGGWYGAGNVGDELLLSTLTRWASDYGARIAAISVDPCHTERVHGIEAVDFFDLPAVASAMARSDLYVLGGGGIFQTHDAFTLAGMYDFRKAEIAMYARPVLMAHQFGLHTLAWAQGVGPLRPGDSQDIVADVFKRVGHLSVRDDASRKLLQKVGLQRDILVAPDPVWAWPVPEVGAPQAVGGNYRIGVVVRSWPKALGWEERFVAALRATVPSHVTLVWIPYQSNSVPSRSESDMGFIEHMIARVGPEYTHEIVRSDQWNDVMTQMRACHGVVAMRLHAQILSLRMGQPTLCIEYDTKMIAASRQARVHTDHCIAVDALGDAWRLAFVSWWQTIERGETSAPLEIVQHLAREALVHREVLHQALDAARERRVTRWQSDGFDWIGAWQSSLSQSALEQRDRMLEHALAEHTSLAAMLADSWKAIAIKEAVVVEQEDRIGEQQNRINEQQHRLEAMSTELVNVTSEVAELTIQIADRDRALELQTQRRIVLEKQAERLLHALESGGGSSSLQGEENLEEWTARVVQAVDGALERIKETNAKGNMNTEQIASLQQALSDCNGEILRLQEEQIRCLQQANQMVQLKEAELQELRVSTSWRITRPMRSLRRFLRSPMMEIREIFAFVRRGSQPEYTTSLMTTSLPSPPVGSQDLTWEEFQERVLAHREQFNGVFIQELSIDWNVPLYQRPQHISTALGRLGYLVIYRTGNWGGDNVDGFREVEANVWLTNSWEVDTIEGAVRSIYSTATTHEPEHLDRHRSRDVVLYEYIDHIDPQISGDDNNITRLVRLKEWAFSGGVDYVVASAKLLRQEAIAEVGEDKVLFAQNGVDTRHYRSPAQDVVELPELLKQVRRDYTKVVGYFGAIAPWLWYEELSKLTASRPDLAFVFIGPDYYGGVGKLPSAPNFFYLGVVDYKILPAHARQFDICFIPFAPGEIARTTSPLKLFEYFALEKPVVVTSDMLECISFPEVLHGDSAESLSTAIDVALRKKDDPVFRARLATLADQNSWENRARAMLPAFEALRRKT